MLTDKFLENLIVGTWKPIYSDTSMSLCMSYPFPYDGNCIVYTLSLFHYCVWDVWGHSFSFQFMAIGSNRGALRLDSKTTTQHTQAMDFEADAISSYKEEEERSE